MDSILILNARIINEGKAFEGDVLVKGQFIEKIGKDLQNQPATRIINAAGSWLFPGVIDDQVHFREPGLTYKGTIRSESRAGVAGGVSSFMEMPNTVPPAFTQQLLEDKYSIAATSSLANYSFFIGASNDNHDEVMKTDITKVCGLKIFMGSSTGNLLVDDPVRLEAFFGDFAGIIATHCEHEPTIRQKLAEFRATYGEDLPARFHPLIRTAEACFASSSFAVGLARKKGTRLHVLHISTERELALFDDTLPLHQKKITAEACVHHLWFNDTDYDRLGMRIKWNPAIKTAADQQAILRGVLDNHIDVIATDHAPHTLAEKNHTYFNAPSGGPLVQHSLVAMLEFYHQKKISLETIVEKMCHNPALLFQIEKRGFVREGFYADLAIVDPMQPWKVEPSTILAHCGWSPFENTTFQSRVTHTIVSGHLAWENGKIREGPSGLRLLFARK